MINDFKRKYFKMLNYAPHSAQQLYHSSVARFRVPVCGRRTGKSLMVGRDVGSDLIIPPKGDNRYTVWIVGPTYDLGEKEFRVIWDDLIIKKGFGKDPAVKKTYNKQVGNMYIEFPWRTRVEVKSAAHPETLVGEALDRAIMSEAAKHSSDTWNKYIRPSLSDKRGSADFPTTPEGHNWLYDVWQLGQNPDIKEYESWNFPTWINTIMYPGGRDDPEILDMQRTMTEEEFLQEVGADFASYTGKIYQDFDETKHVKKVTFNPNWPNYIAFDFGFSAPFAAIEFQIDAWDRVYVWREHYLANRTLEEHIKILQSRNNPQEYHIDLCFGDAEDPEACVVLSNKFSPTICDTRAKANWGEGINLVKQKVRSYPVGDADEYGTPQEEPWLYIDHSCKHTIKEFNTYRFRESEISDPIDASKSGAAIRKNNHALDALRYGLMHVFKLGAQDHLLPSNNSGLEIVTESLLLADFDYSNLNYEGDTMFQMGAQF